jgi:tetratricopeptide (TPR) repeat protein
MRKLAFYFIAIVVFPLILLLCAEGLLRLVGIGQSTPLVVPVPERTGYVMPNPNLIQRFVLNPKHAPAVAPDTQYFLAEKPTDTLRIITLGGSSMAGFPYGRFGAPAAFLQQRVTGLYPDKNIEVINLAMSSINSYALRDIASDVVALSPDAVYVYAGHNEYLGVMGVGSSYAGFGGHALNTLYLSVKDWRLTQLLVGIVSASPEVSNQESSRTVMASVAKNRNIAFDSPAYHRGIEQFRDNMHAMLDTFYSANIPVYFSTLVANDKDQVPFADSYALSDSDTVRLNSAALETLKNLHTQHPFHATVNYRLAQAYLDNGQTNLARQHFGLAKDYDALRFRAPGEINIVISELAEAFDQTYLVDGADMLRRQAEDGIVGLDLMHEHLHPNAKGYFFLAESALIVMQRHLLLPKVNTVANANAAWHHRFVNPADEYLAKVKIARLTSDYPFVPSPIAVPTFTPKNTEEQLGAARLQQNNWLRQQQQLLGYYQTEKDYLSAANVAASLFYALPFDPEMAWFAANLYRQAGSFDYARYFARRVTEMEPNKLQARLLFAEMLFNQRDFVAAKAQLEQALIIDPTHVPTQQYIEQVNQLMHSAFDDEGN